MKIFKYLLFISLVFSTSVFAINLHLKASATCPPTLPAFASPGTRFLRVGYLMVTDYSTAGTPYTMIFLQTSNAADGEAIAVKMQQSGMTSYTATPMYDSWGPSYYCAYTSGTYPTPNISPAQAFSSQATVAYYIYPLNQAKSK